MYRLIHFECENVIGLYNGLNKKRVELNLEDHRDKSVFIILGGNAKGKSTLLSILHPFPSTTDKRDKFIREGKEGFKQLIYERQDGEDTIIRIRHVYMPNKNGGHNTKSFIHKITDGKELDLNPNGNVSTFMMAIEQEFGITEDFMTLSAQNEDMVSLVKMTGSNRKDHVYNFIPKGDDTTVYQRVVSKKYRDVKVHLSSIVDKLGKMEDEVTIKEKLKQIEERTNELAEKRDKHIGKLNKYESELKVLDPDDKLVEKYRKLRSELKELNSKQEKLQNRLDKLLMESGKSQDILSNIDGAISDISLEKTEVREKLIELRSTLQARRNMRSNLYDSMEEKKSLVRQLAGARTKSDMVDLLKEYKERLSNYDSRVKNLNTNLSADDLIRGIDVLENLRTYMYDIHNNLEGEDVLKEAVSAIFSNKFEARYVETQKELDVIKERIGKLNTTIASLNSYEYMKETLERRPKDCVIDTCSFLQDYNKWIAIEKKINEFQSQLDELNGAYQNMLTELQTLTEVHKIKLKVESLITFYKGNYSLLSKLPFNDDYSTQDKLLKRLLKQDMLVGAEKDFYELIEILQDKEEYNEIRNVKIPLLTSEIKNLDQNHGMVDSLNSEIKKLEEKYNDEVQAIENEVKIVDDLEKKLEKLTKEEEFIFEVKEKVTGMKEAKDSIIKLSNEFDSVKEISERIEQLKVKMSERKNKLKIVEAKLKPLTQERDYYKYQEAKITEYKVEKEVLEENLQILELIRDALSTNKGMPVSILRMYVDEIRKSANMLLSDTFDGSLYLDSFVINDKEFTIPYQHNGDRGSDISKASSSERSFISTCLSMSIMEQIIANYGVLNLDEVDAGFSEQNRAVYCAILMKQIKRVGINQVFFITHSREYYEPYDVCYILFPDHTLNSSGKDVIKMY